MRSAQEKTASTLVHELSSHVRDGDARAVAADLVRLREISLDSERQAGARGMLDRIRTPMVQLLFESLPAEEACRAVQGIVAPDEVLQALEHGDFEIDAARLMAAAPFIGFPDVQREPNLSARLIDAAGADISAALDGYIGERAPTERTEGTDYDRHLRTLSAVRTLAWAPDDKGLSRAVALLARRRDPEARALTADLLQGLPWGGNRMATAALVAGILDNADEQTERLIGDALDAHPEPGLARRLMLEALRTYAPDRAVLLALRDLRQCRTDRERVATIEWLYALRRSPAPEAEGDLRKEIQAEIAALNTAGWSRLTRAYLDVLLSAWFPSLSRVTGASAWGRAAIRLIQVFERLRLDHLGCMVTVPLIIGIGYASMVVMNVFLGKPPAGYALVDDGALALWVVTAGLTAHTHFSGHESLRDRFLMGCALLCSIASFYVLSVLVRLLPAGAP